MQQIHPKTIQLCEKPDLIGGRIADKGEIE